VSILAYGAIAGRSGHLRTRHSSGARSRRQPQMCGVAGRLDETGSHLDQFIHAVWRRGGAGLRHPPGDESTIWSTLVQVVAAALDAWGKALRVAEDRRHIVVAALHLCENAAVDLTGGAVKNYFHRNRSCPELQSARSMMRSLITSYQLPRRGRDHAEP
jgi:hypothetical protein